MAKRSSKGSSKESSKILASEALRHCFQRRLGQAIIAASVPDLLYKFSDCPKGVSAVAMEQTIYEMKHKGLIRVKTYPEGHDELGIPPNWSRIKLTGSGRKAFDIKAEN